MVMNEEEVREHCVKLAEECYRLTARLKDTDKTLWDVSKMLEGAQVKEELLLDYIDNMCGMIEAETPLNEHDRWLNDCVAQGFYKRGPH